MVGIMSENALIDEASEYIENKLLDYRRKFEILYSSTTDNAKRTSHAGTLKEIERDIKKLKAGLFTMDDCDKYKIKIEDLQNHRNNPELRKEINEYKIIRNIHVHPLNKYSHNHEINSIWSYLQFFEREYLGLLSEQNLRLDYGHAYQRDKFFTTYNELVRFILRYGELLEQIDHATGGGNKEYRERLLTIQGKQYRDVIIKTGKFLRSIERFIDDLFEAEAQGENVILDPERRVEISGDQSTLNGVTAREALTDLEHFITEFIDFIKIPELTKIEEEE